MLVKLHLLTAGLGGALCKYARSEQLFFGLKGPIHGVWMAAPSRHDVIFGRLQAAMT